MWKRGDPVLPFTLGLMGLIPFWGLALAQLYGARYGLDRDAMAGALATYAATILSFLGGIRWGFAVSANDQNRKAMDYLGSVLPQLLGWGALFLADPWRLALLGVLLLVLGPIDLNLVSRRLAPFWFGRLRLILSIGAAAALLLAAAA